MLPQMKRQLLLDLIFGVVALVQLQSKLIIMELAARILLMRWHQNTKKTANLSAPSVSVLKPKPHSTSTYAWESAAHNPDGVVCIKATKNSTVKAAKNCSWIYATSIAANLANIANKESRGKVVIMTRVMKTLIQDLQKVPIEPNQQMKISLSMRETHLNQLFLAFISY